MKSDNKINAYLSDVYAIFCGISSILIALFSIIQIDIMVPRFDNLFKSLNMELSWLTIVYLKYSWIVISLIIASVSVAVFSMAKLWNKNIGMYISITCLVFNVIVFYLTYKAVLWPITNLQKQLS